LFRLPCCARMLCDTTLRACAKRTKGQTHGTYRTEGERRREYDRNSRER
jgi:hypothetical protein